MSDTTTAGRPAAEPDASTRWQVSETLSRYGHVVDSQEWAYLPLVFAPTATVDAQFTTVSGLAEIQGLLESEGPWRSHHTLNTIMRYDGTEITAWSRFLLVEAAGTTISGDYVDRLSETDAGWRITVTTGQPA